MRRRKDDHTAESIDEQIPNWSDRGEPLDPPDRDRIFEFDSAVYPGKTERMREMYWELGPMSWALLRVRPHRVEWYRFDGTGPNSHQAILESFDRKELFRFIQKADASFHRPRHAQARLSRDKKLLLRTMAAVAYEMTSNIDPRGRTEFEGSVWDKRLDWML
jgi:hypothetical protein